jgi:RHS repeat-associated protein
MNNIFSSQASNFVSALQTQVDPRTGQFMLNLPLITLVGNNQLGPELSLSLSYSPLITGNAGFGVGFGLGMTQFNNKSNLLELSNGEKYRVIPGSDIVRNKKLDNFRFSYTNGINDADGYTVLWKEGKKEILTVVEDGETFVTTQILSPLGRQLTLSWDWSGQYTRLERINDEFSTLVQMRYGAVITMTVWPGTQEAYETTFELINDTQLDTVSRQVSGGESLRWYFEYDAVDGAQSLLLTGVRYPTGMTDRVEYNQSLGLQFPDESGLGRLPAVLSHIHAPGHGQPETVTFYEYTVQNFLGYNSNFGNWSADSDYLYTTLTDYTYGSTETVSDGDVTVTTERIYNNYHLLVSETRLREGSSYSTELTYYAVPWDFIDAQPPQFQCVRETKEVWTDTGGKSRTRVTLAEYDESGNPTREVRPDGTEILNDWYGADGEEGCPAEPNGFVRFLKQTTLRPRATAWDDTPEHITRYTYNTVGDTAFVVQDGRTKYSGNTPLLRETTEYVSDSASPEFGRVIALVNDKYEGETTFTLRQDFSTVISDGLMTQTITCTGHDGLTASSERIQSALSGQLYSEKDTQGIKTVYTSDALGRLLTRIAAFGTEYENTTTWHYAIDDEGPVTTETDASGNQLKTCFDGEGRETGIFRFDTDHSREWYSVGSRHYNALGEYQSGSGEDWLTTGDGAPVNFTVQGEAGYDRWGFQAILDFSDSTRSVQETDPIGLMQRNYSQGGEGEKQLTSGQSIVILDEQSQLPVREEWRDATGTLQSTRRYEYDGLGQLREQEDERGNLTQFTYDVFGRELTRTLADGSIVTRTYASHLTDNQATCIQVTGPDAGGSTQTWIMGTRTFDSLGRLTEETVGGRKTTYHYDGVSPLPNKVIPPSGNIQEYTYIPELDHAIASRTADGITQEFQYDSLTGDLLVAREGSTENFAIWTPSGSLKEERFTREGNTRQSSHLHTLAGEPVAYTDITGHQIRYERDSYGRITGITDDVLTVTLEYDVLGRLQSQDVKNTTDNTSLNTTLAYDDFGREVSRTLTDGSSSVLVITQTWLKNSLLDTRLTEQDGVVLRDERYEYDSRNRLIGYRVAGSHLPSDGYGHRMAEQIYRYDALDNLTQVVTTLADGTADTAVYQYSNDDDPTQLTAVTHTHGNYPGTVDLKYDDEGRMVQDEAGRRLTYDATGRLASAGDDVSGEGHYRYDALNYLVSQTLNDTDRRELYYRGSELVNEVRVSKNQEVRLIKSGHTCLGVSSNGSLTLTAGDQNDSLLWSRETGQAGGKLHAWSPYGGGEPADLLTGFNGERADPLSGCYHLGNGYRAYNPALMRFNCPDSLSPFGVGGINPYAYCAGDPINHTDPSGHISWQGIVGIVVGAIGLSLAVVTGGASIAAAGGVMAAISSASAVSLTVGTLGVIADVTAIASGATEASNPGASSVLGWVSLGAGLAGVVPGARRALRGFSSTQRGKEHLTEYGTKVVSESHIVRDNDLILETSGYTDKFKGINGEQALMFHGSKTGGVWVGAKVSKTSAGKLVGKQDDAGNLTAMYINKGKTINAGKLPDYLRVNHGLDLSSSDRPLHLISCYAKRKAGQALADNLNRPVVAYSKHTVIAPIRLEGIESRALKISAAYRKNDPRRLFMGGTHNASPRIYYPSYSTDAHLTGSKWKPDW